MWMMGHQFSSGPILRGLNVIRCVLTTSLIKYPEQRAKLPFIFLY
jgi:hypothetical protein